MQLDAYRRHTTVLSCAVLAAMCCAFAADPPKQDSKPDADLAPIDFKLPTPYFGSTPLVYNGPHFEVPDFAPRKPFLAPKGAANIARNKPVIGSALKTTYGTLGLIVDGEKGYEQEHVVELPGGTQWIQIDLGQESEIYAVLVWHFHAMDRVYFDVIVRTADDADFAKNVRTLYNNDYDNTSGLGAGTDKEYVEDYRGRLINAMQDGKGTLCRYVRLYSKGNTSDDANHYIEVEVWGKPTASK